MEIRGGLMGTLCDGDILGESRIIFWIDGGGGRAYCG